VCGGVVRKRTVRTGLRFMIASVLLLLLGTFYSQQINALFSLPPDGAFEFVKLAFFWSTIFGATGVIVLIFGLIKRSSAVEKFSLAPVFFLFIFLLTVFFTLFYRTLSSPPVQQPLKPGETLII
jgi:glucan phosphoethanolaminetransferase (alkaline phosphatase superfamily)